MTTFLEDREGRHKAKLDTLLTLKFQLFDAAPSRTAQPIIGAAIARALSEAGSVAMARHTWRNAQSLPTAS